jgi:hypothetical protein
MEAYEVIDNMKRFVNGEIDSFSLNKGDMKKLIDVIELKEKNKAIVYKDYTILFQVEDKQLLKEINQVMGNTITHATQIPVKINVHTVPQAGDIVRIDSAVNFIPTHRDMWLKLNKKSLRIKNRNYEIANEYYTAELI